MPALGPSGWRTGGEQLELRRVGCGRIPIKTLEHREAVSVAYIRLVFHLGAPQLHPDVVFRYEIPTERYSVFGRVHRVDPPGREHDCLSFRDFNEAAIGDLIHKKRGVFELVRSLPVLEFGEV